jgi:hypothetical protein
MPVYVGFSRVLSDFTVRQPSADCLRGDTMDAKAIAESVLLVLIVLTGGALLPDLMRYIKLGHVKYGRRAKDL